ncbi:MAG: ELKS/Rab6-interacting/CAST family protein [Candidatus Doudnabacteria bacterium]|nr:ELKS/Rab6-interacting/CAST family protein [Candidatus Doudnabacteria bacterium]
MIKSPFTTQELRALQTVTEQAPLIRAIFQLKEKVLELETELKEATEESDKVNLVTFQNLKQELQDLEERINNLRPEKGDKGDSIVGPRGPKGDKGDTTVVEKVIEKTEVIREIPIVTENVVEKAVPESAEVIAEKLGLETLLEELRKEFDVKLTRLPSGRGIGGVPGLLTYVGGAKKGFLKGVNFVGATHSVVNGLDTITIAASGGSVFETPAETPDGSNTVFTVLHEPDYIIVDGTTLFPDVDALGNTPYSYDSGTGQITITNGNPPVLFVKSFYTP